MLTDWLKHWLLSQTVCDDERLCRLAEHIPLALIYCHCRCQCGVWPELLPLLFLIIIIRFRRWRFASYSSCCLHLHFLLNNFLCAVASVASFQSSANFQPFQPGNLYHLTHTYMCTSIICTAPRNDIIIKIIIWSFRMFSSFVYPFRCCRQHAAPFKCHPNLAKEYRFLHGVCVCISHCPICLFVYVQRWCC